MRHRDTGILLFDEKHATDGFTLIVPLGILNFSSVSEMVSLVRFFLPDTLKYLTLKPFPLGALYEDKG